MRINEILTESVSPSQIGDALRSWTSNTIYYSRPQLRTEQLAAAKLLASVPGQNCPNFAYRAFGININKIKSWTQFANKVESQYPESYSGSIQGVKRFLKDRGVDAIGMVIGIHLSPSDCMFDVKSIAKMLPPKELSKPDRAGFGIKEYLGQQEVVLQPGALKRALMSGNAYLVGYEVPGTNEFKWLPTPHQINPN